MNQNSAHKGILRVHTTSCRIDGAIKEEAAAVLAALGLTVSGAVRLMLTRVAREKRLPFEPLIPNAETIEAMREAIRGGGDVRTFATVEEMWADLDSDGDDEKD